MFYACSFLLNLATFAPATARARVISIKTTTLKG
jgi:hypothetical protein